MGPIGLKHTQFSLLAILSYGEQQSISTLAELLGLERTSLTRTLRPLESQRLVERTDEGYRRQKMIRITAAGMEKYEQGLPLWQAAQARLNARLTGDERAQLHALLDLAQGV
jgi:DNA-binding MarR family transcriptional regulator